MRSGPRSDDRRARQVGMSPAAAALLNPYRHDDPGPVRARSTAARRALSLVVSASVAGGTAALLPSAAHAATDDGGHGWTDGFTASTTDSGPQDWLASVSAAPESTVTDTGGTFPDPGEADTLFGTDDTLGAGSLFGTGSPFGTEVAAEPSALPTPTVDGTTTPDPALISLDSFAATPVADLTTPGTGTAPTVETPAVEPDLGTFVAQARGQRCPTYQVRGQAHPEVYGLDVGLTAVVCTDGKAVTGVRNTRMDLQKRWDAPLWWEVEESRVAQPYMSDDGRVNILGHMKLDWTAPGLGWFPGGYRSIIPARGMQVAPDGSCTGWTRVGPLQWLGNSNAPAPCERIDPK
ncbi:MAG TPA: hypothetical protein VD813_12970 [Pseudonocardia sp.]|nr:hypothetical protein [Pseudonocardia sp.]